MLKGYTIFAMIAAVLLAAFGGEAGTQKVEMDDCNPTGVGFSCNKQGKLPRGTQMVNRDECDPTGVGFSCNKQGKLPEGSQIVEKDDCNPTGVGFSCNKQGKLLKGLRLDAKKIIIVPPKCPDGKRLDRNGKCKTIY